MRNKHSKIGCLPARVHLLASLLLANSCLLEKNPATPSSTPRSSAFGFIVSIPADVANDMGCKALVALTAQSNFGNRVFKAENVAVCHSTQEPDLVVFEKDDRSTVLAVGDQLSQLHLQIARVDGTIVYESVSKSDQGTSLTVAEGVNRLEVTLSCAAESQSTCGKSGDLQTKAISPPAAADSTKGNSADQISNASAQNPSLSTAGCKCGRYQNVCMIWIPGEANALAVLNSTTCDENTCERQFPLQAYQICGGGMNVEYAGAIK